MIVLTDTTPSEPKSLIELKARKTVKPAAAPETLQDRVDAAFNPSARDLPSAPEVIRGGAGGAAEAAGVLTAVDEDVEGGEEAELPRPFDYYEDENESKEEEQ